MKPKKSLSRRPVRAHTHNPNAAPYRNNGKVVADAIAALSKSIAAEREASGSLRFWEAVRGWLTVIALLEPKTLINLVTPAGFEPATLRLGI